MEMSSARRIGNRIRVTADPQLLLDRLQTSIDVGDHPCTDIYSYHTLLDTLESPVDGVDPPSSARVDVIYRQLLTDISIAGCGKKVYLINERFYSEAVLDSRFPELRVFDITHDDAFVNPHPSFPQVFAETRRFSRLRVLSPMREEALAVGISPGYTKKSAVELVMILMGFTAPPVS